MGKIHTASVMFFIGKHILKDIDYVIEKFEELRGGERGATTISCKLGVRKASALLSCL